MNVQLWEDVESTAKNFATTISNMIDEGKEDALPIIGGRPDGIIKNEKNPKTYILL